jgi:hypothetical protein
MNRAFSSAIANDMDDFNRADGAIGNSFAHGPTLGIPDAQAREKLTAPIRSVGSP